MAQLIGNKTQWENNSKLYSSLVLFTDLQAAVSVEWRADEHHGSECTQICHGEGEAKPAVTIGRWWRRDAVIVVMTNES